MGASVEILGATIQQDDLFKAIDGVTAAGAAYHALCMLSKFAMGQGEPSDIARGMLAGAMASKCSTDLKDNLWTALKAVDTVL